MKSIKLAVLGLAVALSAGLAHADTRVLKKVPPEFPAAATKKGRQLLELNQYKPGHEE